jgi:uncharacterized protein YjbJ (UPF0337 family)
VLSGRERVVGYRGQDSGEETVVARSKARDKSGGTIDKIVGRIKEAGGALAGNEPRKVRGQSRQTKGSAKQKKGHLRDLFK